MNGIRSFINRLALIGLGDISQLRREEGQTLIEYALILVLIAVVVIAVITLLGTQISSIFNRVQNAL
jgi:pilus assembly protein Flp/PilA